MLEIVFLYKIQVVVLRNYADMNRFVTYIKMISSQLCNIKRNVHAGSSESFVYDIQIKNCWFFLYENLRRPWLLNVQQKYLNLVLLYFEFKKTFYFQLCGCFKYQIHHEYEKLLYLKLQNICLFLNFWYVYREFTLINSLKTYIIIN